ncbi:uncharacterized protein LOC116173532 [Photinus pyralis]|uniref:uncharacterized protein LOC116173532 n=1 Tax=Photinus pyralis TaxID=7054 RepID=UPI0012673779|nr:uncharacterized protein LOC116173532 [Photinus pyralis]
MSLLHVKRTSTDSSVEAVDSSFSELPAATPSGVSTSSATTTLTSTLGLETVVLLATAIVDIFDAKGNSHAIRVLLDSANQANFINEKCAHRLCLTKRSLTTAIFGLNQMHSISAKGVAACAIQPHKATGPIFSFDAIVISKLCQDLPTFNINAQNWKHLDNLELADGNFHADKSIDLLIGAEVFAHVLKEGRIIGKQGEPTALNTVFGWVLLGKIHSSRETTKRVETYCTYINEATLPETLHKFWEVGEISSKLPYSSEDAQCELIYRETVSRTREGRFMVTLPFKNSEPDLGNTFPLAHRRFLLLETRLLKNLDSYNAYSSFMRDYLKNGYMSVVDLTKSSSALCYYLPHHGVLKSENTTTKLRVVCDASAKSPKGLSLNDTLLTGPKLQKDISALLLTFTYHPIVFTADIKQMYLQILVTPQHRDYQRILWRFSPNDPTSVYRLTGCHSEYHRHLTLQ